MPRRSVTPAVVALSLAVSACAGLPVAGPLTADIIDNGDRANPAHVNYIVVDVTRTVCDIVAARPAESLHATFQGDGPPPVYTVSIGDALAITVWEAGAGGLLTSVQVPNAVAPTAPSARGAPLPPMTVEQDGAIAMPFAGRIAVAGKTPAEIERLIVARLKGKTVDPQVVVSVAHSSANTVAVGGEVTAGARVPLSVRGDRIFDVISAAGGIRIPVNESVVRLTRGALSARVSYDTILDHPDENIYLRPGDVLTVLRAPRTFTVFGAFGRNVQIPFETDGVSAAEAVAQAGGLLDQRVDPSGIFIFRNEPLALAGRLAPGAALAERSDTVPVIYHLNMSDPGAYFLAQSFAIRDKDVVYAANAKFNEVQKFLTLLGSVLAPAATTAAVGSVVH
ncbi:MAG TPA: polysaccharide biosynthesis/export family protein [Rhizomicrobium sp.]